MWKELLDLIPLCEKWNLGLTLMYNTTHAIVVENRYWAQMGHQKRVIPSLFQQQRDMEVEGAEVWDQQLYPPPQYHNDEGGSRRTIW